MTIYGMHIKVVPLTSPPSINERHVVRQMTNIYIVLFIMYSYPVLIQCPIPPSKRNANVPL